MLLTLISAYAAGALTLINPCVLPLLPIIVASALQASALGPTALAAGLTLSFTVVGVGVTAFGHALGIDDQLINRVAAGLMLTFGVVLLVPKAQAVVSSLVSPLASGANTSIDKIADKGLLGQFGIGVLLGAVWSPCIGPTLGGAIGLAAAGENSRSGRCHNADVWFGRFHGPVGFVSRVVGRARVTARASAIGDALR